MIVQDLGNVICNTSLCWYTDTPQHTLTWADKLGFFQNNITEVLFALIVAYAVITVAKEICQCATHHSNNDLKATELEFEDDDEN